MRCSNNMKQIILAAHNYHSATGQLPPTWTKPATSSDGWSVQARLLPYLESVALGSAVDFGSGYNNVTITVNGNAVKVASFRVGTYLCPDEVNDTVRMGSSGPKHYPLSYVANQGRWFVYDPVDPDYSRDDRSGEGMFTPTRGRRFRDCLDGLSNTLAFAEIKAWTPYLRDASVIGDMNMPARPEEITLLGGTFRENSGHTEWVDGRVHQTGFTTTFTPNTKVWHTDSGIQYDVDFTNFREGKSFGPTPYPRTYAAVTSRSYHSAGGVMTSQCDGSVRFVTDSIDRDLWQHLSTRAGYEAVQVPE